MTIRRYQESDRPRLSAFAEASGFPYEDPTSEMLEALLVAEDDEGNILGAVAAKRIVELYLWKAPGMPPLVAREFLRQMHENMAKELRTLGYHEANSFLPPSICQRFGRRLRKTFGWVENWPSMAIRF